MTLVYHSQPPRRPPRQLLPQSLRSEVAGGGRGEEEAGRTEVVTAKEEAGRP